VECSYENVKDIQMSMIKNTFCVKVIYNENHEITTEYKKPIKRDTIDEVNTNIIEMDINNIQQEQMNISCMVKETEVKEEQKEEVKEEQQEEPEQQEEEPEEPKKDEPEEEEQKKDKTLSIEELKEILTDKLEKKNTALSYGRTIKQVYNFFKTDDIYSLLQKEKDIIDFIEDKYKTNISSISSKLCGVLKCYTVLNLKSKLLKDRIQHYKVLLKVKQDTDKEKVIDKKTIEEGEEILNHCKNEMDKLGEKVKNDIQLLNTWDISVQMYCVLKYIFRDRKSTR